jgi:hypothetical protein
MPYRKKKLLVLRSIQKHKYTVWQNIELEDNIKIDLHEVEWGGMEWIDLAQDKDRWRTLVNAIMNLRFP